MNDSFCSDIVSLFWNHLWECNDCWFKVFAFILVVYLLAGLITISINFFTEKICRREYNELESEFEKLNDSYAELLVDYYNVTLRCSDLEKKLKS